MPDHKIKEAFDAWWKLNGIELASYAEKSAANKGFRSGYLACLNGLEYAATLTDNGKEKVAYFLPEGVAK